MEVRTAPPSDEPDPEPSFDEEPLRWDHHRHRRRVRTAMFVAMVLATMTSLSLCMARDQAGQAPHPPRPGPTQPVRDGHAASGWTERARS